MIFNLIWLQEDENALLQQALAMSMEDPASSHDVQDTEMSDAAINDPELALGKVMCFKFTHSLLLMCTFLPSSRGLPLHSRNFLRKLVDCLLLE